jgi:hypothetical protein
MPGHALAIAHEARARDVVGAPAGDRVEHPLEVGREVLAVSVDVDRCGVALVAGQLEACAQCGAEAARRLMRDDPRAPLAGDRRRGVARAVVDEQQVDRHPARPIRDAGEDLAHGGLLVAGHDDGDAPAGDVMARGLGRRIQNRNQGTAARRDRSVHPKQVGDRGGHLADRVRLPADRPGDGSRPPHDERHRTLAPVEVTMAADAASLSVVGHHDHGGVLELAPLIEECQEIANVAVRLGELVEVLRAAHATDMAELIGGQQLEDEQVRILLVDHTPRLRA